MKEPEIPKNILKISESLKKGKIPRNISELLKITSISFRGDLYKRYSKLHSRIYIKKDYIIYEQAGIFLLNHIERYRKIPKSYDYSLDGHEKEWIDNFSIQTILRSCAEFLLKALFLKKGYYVNKLKKGEWKPLQMKRANKKLLKKDYVVELSNLRKNIGVIIKIENLEKEERKILKNGLALINFMGNNVIHTSNLSSRRGDYIDLAYTSLLIVFREFKKEDLKKKIKHNIP